MQEADWSLYPGQTTLHSNNNFFLKCYNIITNKFQKKFIHEEFIVVLSQARQNYYAICLILSILSTFLTLHCYTAPDWLYHLENFKFPLPNVTVNPKNDSELIFKVPLNSDSTQFQLYKEENPSKIFIASNHHGENNMHKLYQTALREARSGLRFTLCHEDHFNQLSGFDRLDNDFSGTGQDGKFSDGAELENSIFIKSDQFFNVDKSSCTYTFNTTGTYQYDPHRLREITINIPKQLNYPYCKDCVARTMTSRHESVAKVIDWLRYYDIFFMASLSMLFICIIASGLLGFVSDSVLKVEIGTILVHTRLEK